MLMDNFVGQLKCKLLAARQMGWAARICIWALQELFDLFSKFSQILYWRIYGVGMLYQILKFVYLVVRDFFNLIPKCLEDQSKEPLYFEEQTHILFTVFDISPRCWLMLTVHEYFCNGMQKICTCYTLQLTNAKNNNNNDNKLLLQTTHYSSTI